MRAPRLSTADPETLRGEPLPASGRTLANRNRNPELDAAIGARIRAARVTARMSRVELGETLGISYQQLQKYEKGGNRVSASTLQEIAAVLNVHPGSLFDDNMPMQMGSAPTVRAAMRGAEILQQIRDPRVFKQLLALAKALVELDGNDVELPASGEGEG